jgi:uncharacterized protein (DUF885 family)
MPDALSSGRSGGAVSAHLERTRAAGIPPNAAEPAIRALLDDVVADDPEVGTMLGLTVGADRLPSWSAPAMARRIDVLHGHERRLRPLVAADDTAVAVDSFAALQIVRRRLRDLELRRVNARHPAACLEVLNGLFPLVVREYGTLDQRVDALAGRLHATPAFLEEARCGLESELSEVAVSAAISSADGLLDLMGPTMRDFAAAAGRAGALDEPSSAACAALASFRDWLRDELLPPSTPECAAGRPVIEDILRWEHVLAETPEELAEYGREVLAETKSRMGGIAGDLGYPDVATAVAAIQADTPAPDDVVAAYRRAVVEAREFIVSHDIVTVPAGEELEVAATPEFLRSILPYAAYFQPGPFEKRQLGFYYVTPPRKGLFGPQLEEALRNHPNASLPTTGVHEAYPGHHLQLVSANLLPTTVRRVAGLYNGGNLLVEGWAFYCEELMEREGLLSDPAVRLMRLNDQIWRACRVVIDVELHLGIMDMPSAVRFLSTESHANVSDSTLECRRYAEEPGQAMSYLLGKREVLRLAEVCRRERPGSLREFHDELLSWGSLPPAVIAWGMGLGPRPAAARLSS